MIIRTQSGLALAKVVLRHYTNSIILKDVLLDTGCAVTVFDTDSVEPIGLVPDRKNGILVSMFGIGGKSELCIQQFASNLEIDSYQLCHFQFQLSNLKETYGFDGILGNDFLTAAGLIDWNRLSLPKTTGEAPSEPFQWFH